ncbi:hypothetical protein [Emticicia sp.]|uniref:hypothetical protein n=1 Tax=Emticicia sp. TaxID=1930953 RepID=UPI003751C3FE
MKTNYTIIIFLCFVITKKTFSQVVTSDNRFEMTLKRQKIVVLPTYSDNSSFHPYYYLPANLHVSEKNGSPEFSFLTYKKDDNSDIEGGIMNFLLTWGLNAEQEGRVQNELFNQDSTATLMGALMVESVGFEITGTKQISQILKKTMSSTGNVPNTSGGKLALSFKFNGEDTKAISKAIKNPKSVEDIDLVFKFRYKTMNQTDNWNISLNLCDLFSYVITFPQCVR